PYTLPPAIAIGTLALTASCFAVASASASCFVFADWSTFWLWPLPPQPAVQLELPPVCVGVAVWLVVLEFDPSAVPVWGAVLFPALEPPSTLPPAIATGTLALTASCFASASASASWFVF